MKLSNPKIDSFLTRLTPGETTRIKGGKEDPVIPVEVQPPDKKDPPVVMSGDDDEYGGEVN